MKRAVVVILIHILLISCMPEQEFVPIQTEGGTTGSSTNTPTTNTNTNSNTSSNPFQYDISWYSSSKYLTSLIINSDDTRTFYIRGNYIHNYLLNTQNYGTHCLIMDFTTANFENTQLRVRAIPQSITHYGTNKIEKYFRLDMGSGNSNKANCKGDDIFPNAQGQFLLDNLVDTDTAHYTPDELCQDCKGKLIAKKLRLKKSVYSGSEWTLDPTYAQANIDFAKINFSVNMTNDSNNDNPNCTNTECRSQGFDCCLDGQCVKDGAPKPGAVDLAGYDDILELLVNNPSAYSSYPEYFYICQTIITGTDPGGSGTGTTDPNANINAAQEAFNKLKNDYNCLNELKEQAESQPFHVNPINPEGEYQFCNTDDITDDLYYKNVLTRLYNNCGCATGTLENRINSCPYYEYEARNLDQNQEPTEIVCKTPPVVQDIPFQDLTIAVSSRSAPHRFYSSSDGSEYFDLSKIFNQNIEQEGSTFIYQDSAKLLPVNGSFNMNSILGQIAVSLDQALPAKKIDVEEGASYVINTISGYYTPCPTCAKDNWMSAFTAFPTSVYGTGLQAVGYTTQRDSYAYNSTFGNYEDTIFGRACYVPPTMLPYSHLDKEEVVDQRLARLKTQAALYINGYQKDWFGFNKGALIGSFDGFKWFAVGKGRLVTATSNKLFLAINAPYADLASATTHSVSIQEYKGITSAATSDYNHNLPFNHAKQNEAATCQRFHTCNVDSDCVSQLGWEYSCADVRKSKTFIPGFTPEADEKNEGLMVTLEGILKQPNGLLTSSSKRCVYRGRGSVCRKDAHSIADSEVRKLLTCAPNFYCAGLDSEVFSKEVTRMVGSFDIMPYVDSLYGRDTNILGRPFNYIGDSNTLDEEIVENLQANIQLTDDGAGDNEGICMPGKALPSEVENPFEAHASADENLRTDYISQIGGCDADNAAENKYMACPVFGEDGNLLNTSPTFFSSLEEDEEAALTNYRNLAKTQNSCGGEAKSEEDQNPFELIEALSIAEGIKTNAPTMARDACYRRAGSICHTDLDCAPNKLHLEQINQFGGDLANLFGNVPEQKYWEETLVCGQATPEPNIYSSNYTLFDMKKNRCCREVGSDLTLYSESTPGMPETDELNTKMDSYLNPSEAGRYSRYTVIDNSSGVTGFADRSDGDLEEKNDINILTKKQWVSVSETARKTCCGGGWVRKFADGTNDWTKKRLSLDVTNFRCINYQSPILMADNPTADYGVSSLTYSKEFNFTCAESEDTDNPSEACMQVGMNPSSDDFAAIAPKLNTSTAVVTVRTMNHKPTKWSPYAPKSGDGVATTFFDHSLDGAERTRHYKLHLRLPLYIAPNRLGGTLNVIEEKALGINKSCPITKASSCPASFDADDASGVTGSPACAACLDTTTGILKVKQNGYPGGSDHYVSFNFNPTGTQAAPGNDGVASDAGNIFYYLRKLGKLELIGIPQVFYEPLTCNSEHKKLVPGIFKAQAKTITNYSTDNYSFKLSGSIYNLPSSDPTNPNKRASTADALEHDQIFSPHEMKCCLPLGTTTKDASNCCSGFGVTAGGTDKICKLPNGTDLSVYFNRFISSEGTGEGMPAGGWVDSDFDENTGEPKLTEEIFQKLNAMGTEWCNTSTTRRGGAFGAFPPEPAGPTSQKETADYSIVDSFRDEADGLNQNGDGGAGKVGFEAFSKGFRWNHHVYCDE